MIKFSQYYLVEGIEDLIKENEEKESLNREFILKMMNYLDGLFPSYGKFDGSINNELQKYMRSGENGKDIRRIKKRIHDILQKAKNKMLGSIQAKVEKIQVVPKVKKKAFEPVEPVETEIEQEEELDGDATT